MRILRVITRLAGGGPSRHVLALHRTLREQGLDTWLAAGDCEPGETSMEYLCTPADAVIRIPGLRRRPHLTDDVRALGALVQWMRRIRPDVVHTHTAKAGALGRIAARLARVPAVVHTFHGHVMRGYFPPLTSRLIQGAERALAGLTDGIVTLSEGLRQEMVTNLGTGHAARVHAIPLGLDLTQLSALPLPPMPWDAPVVAWIGRMVPVKNLPLLAEVIAATLKRLPQARFLLAGDGPERAILAQTAERFPQSVELLPWTENPAALIGRAHLLLLTSRNEGTPVALLEGLAAGRRFVATAVGGVPELAEWSGSSVVPPVAAEAAAQIESLARAQDLPGDLSAEQRWHAASADARREVLSRYSIASMAGRHRALYQALLEQEGRWRHAGAHLAARC